MRIVVAGSSGLIGDALITRLRASGHEVLRLVRHAPREADERGWDPAGGRIDSGTFDGVDAVVNLCGAPLTRGRWSDSRKQLLADSRLEPTDVLAEAIAEHGIPVLVNASGIHYYGDTGGHEVDETAPPGSGFLAELCAAWEAATAPAADAGARVVLLRTAPVLSGQGGMLGRLAPLFRLGLGARLGNGKQPMPWISLPDHVAALCFVLEQDVVTGPVNMTSPHPVTNAEFTRALGRALHRPAPWRVPGIALRAVFGDAAEEMVLTGPKAVPRVLSEAGFRFSHRDLEDALTAVL